MKIITLNVSGMSCQHCVNSIEGELKKLGATGKVDLTNNTVEVQFDETKLTESQINEVIENQGYEVV